MADSGAYIGCWRDYSASAMSQYVLTLPLQWAAVLISFLAILISEAGSSFWSVLSFILHWARVPHNSDITSAQLQLQVLLRNSQTPQSAAADALSILFAWPKSTRSDIRSRALAIAAAAIATWAVFFILGISVVAIASGSEDEVIALVNPSACGLWSPPSSLWDPKDVSLNKLMFLDIANTTLRNRAYAKAWYAAKPSNTAPQSYFPLMALPYTTHEVPCPFEGDGRCLSNHSSNTALMLDTGRLNSHLHLGINAPADRTIDFRWVATCSPVNVQDMHKRVVYEGLGYDVLDVGTASQRVFIDADLGNFFFADGTSNGLMYTVRSALYMPAFADEEQTWVPNSVFIHDDADVVLFAIRQNSVFYLDPVYDPLFSANGTRTAVYTSENVFYLADNPVTAIACLGQVQYCNPNNGRCTDLTHAILADDQASQLGLNADQSFVVSRLLIPTVMCSMFQNGLGMIGTAGLLATEYMFGGAMSNSLPPDHWKNEVSLWFQTGLSKLQEFIMLNVQIDVLDTWNSQYLVQTPQDANLTAAERAAAEFQCANQKFRTRGHVQHFKLIPLAIVASASFFVILLNLILAPCIKMSGRLGRTRIGRVKKKGWDFDSRYYLLRVALEGVGVGPWRAGGREEKWDVQVMDSPVALQPLTAGSSESERFYQPRDKPRAK